jgi:hypothetical protein
MRAAHHCRPRQDGHRDNSGIWDLGRGLKTQAATKYRGENSRDDSQQRADRLLSIGQVAPAKGAIDQDKLKRRYRALLDATSRVMGQAKLFSAEIAQS